MKIKPLFHIVLGGLVLLSTACARHKIIPDERLALIVHDAFLANAYVGSKSLKLDSLNLYEPLFASYGYTTEDVQYTIGNFSKRKSARLGDVVERAIVMLEAEGKFYDREVAVLDTIDNVAVRTFTRKLHSDSLIRVASLADTARLSFTFETSPGEYEVRFDYRIDSLDRNDKGVRSVMWLERADSSRTATQTATLRRYRDESLVRRFTTDTTHRRLRIELLDFNNAAPRRPSISVRNFTVEYRPEKRMAVEQLYDRQLDIRIFADDFFGALRLASDTLRTHAAQPKDSL